MGPLGLSLENDTNSELIKLVYTIAVEPHKLHLMQKVLDEKLQEIYASSEAGLEDQSQSPSQLFQDIEVHFQHAMDLLERKGRDGQKNSVAVNIINTDPQPAALIFPNGIVMHANAAAKELCNFVEGRRVPPDVFDPKISRKFFKDLRSLTRLKERKLIGVYQGSRLDDSPIKFTLAKAEDIEGRAIGRITCMTLSWNEKIGRQFMESFDLTPIEKEITRSIVSGNSLSDLAKSRNRSLGTVRNQLKKLLSKLELRSQTELMSLYSSFSQITHMPYDFGGAQPFLEETSRLHFKMERTNGLNLSYEIVGAQNKNPVLYLHPIIGGTGLSDEMRHEIEARSLRMVMPWRPYFYDTDESGPIETITERYAEDMELLLDKLEINQCVVLAGNEASMYAYAIAQHMPERIKGMVITAGAIPFSTPEQFKLMSPQQRIPHFLAKHAPGMINMYVRAVLAMFDAGYDEEYIYRFFEGSNADLELLQSKDFKDLIRAGVSFAFTQGHKSVSTELILGASDWGYLTEHIQVPVRLVSGRDDQEFPVQTLETFIADKPGFELKIVETAGTFVIYNKPQVIFEEISDLLSDN